MALPNVNQLTSQLRMLPDPALQQAAMMYKNDPYILPMIISEDTARKQMRSAAQSRAMGQEPPKVVDQAIASIGQMMAPQGPGGPMPQGPGGPQGGQMPPQGGPMPPQGAGPQGAGPQSAGIAALQAPNMQRMADGGIAGYPDEDEEIGMAEGGVARYNGATGSVAYVNPYVQGVLALDPDFDEQGQPRTRRESEMIRAKQKEATRQKRQAEDYAVGLNMPPPEYIQRMEDFYRPRYPAAALETPQKTVMPVPNVPGAAAPAAPPGAAPQPGPRPGAGNRPAGPAPAAAAPSAAMAVEKPTVAGAKETAAQFLDRDALERQSQQYLKDEEAAITQARMRREAAAANQGKAYAGLESLLKKEEEGSKGQLDQAKAFALIDAGLAMAAGRSPNALQNIAEGLGVGSKRYQGAISDFNKAAKERQKAMADIENARRAEARDDAKAQLLFEDRADERMANARKFGIDAIMGAGIKNAEIATRIYDNNMTQAGQDRRTQMELTGRAAEGAADRATRLQIANIQSAARSDPQSKEALAVARVQAAINGSPMLKALAEKAKFDPSAAAQYAVEEERLYLRNAPELLLGQTAPGAQSSARSAADAILQKKP